MSLHGGALVDFIFYQLARLMISPEAGDARKIFIKAADRLGCKSDVEEVLGPDEASVSVLNEASLARQFQRLDGILRGKNERACDGFFKLANTVAALSAQLRETVRLGNNLLKEVDGAGVRVIENPLAKRHIQEVLSLLDRMGTIYMQHPERWSRLIHNASWDIECFRKIIDETVIGQIREINDGYVNGSLKDPYLQIVQWLFPEAMKMRRAHHLDNRAREQFERLSFEINIAFNEGRPDDVLQLALEIWVREVDVQKIYDFDKETLASIEGQRADQNASLATVYHLHARSSDESGKSFSACSEYPQIVEDGSADAVNPATEDVQVNSGEVLTEGASIMTEGGIAGMNPCLPRS